MLNVNWKKKITKNIPRLKNFNNNVYRFSTVGHGTTGALTLKLSVNLLKVNNKISCCSRILDQFMLNKITINIMKQTGFLWDLQKDITQFSYNDLKLNRNWFISLFNKINSDGSITCRPYAAMLENLPINFFFASTIKHQL